MAIASIQAAIATRAAQPKSLGGFLFLGIRQRVLLLPRKVSDASANQFPTPCKKNKPAMRNSARVSWNTFLALAFVRVSGAIAEATVMNRKTKKCWGTILLEMALDANQEGDLVTAELLVAHAMNYFQEAAGRLDGSIPKYGTIAWNSRCS